MPGAEPHLIFGWTGELFYLPIYKISTSWSPRSSGVVISSFGILSIRRPFSKKYLTPRNEKPLLQNNLQNNICDMVYTAHWSKEWKMCIHLLFSSVSISHLLLIESLKKKNIVLQAFFPLFFFSWIVTKSKPPNRLVWRLFSLFSLKKKVLIGTFKTLEYGAAWLRAHGQRCVEVPLSLPFDPQGWYLAIF